MCQAGEGVSGSILAVDNGPVSVCAQVVMGTLMISLHRKHEIRCQPFVWEVMLETYVVQVGSVVDGPREIEQGQGCLSGLIELPARVAGRPARVRPAEMDVIGRRYL